MQTKKKIRIAEATIVGTKKRCRKPSREFLQAYGDTDEQAIVKLLEKFRSLQSGMKEITSVKGIVFDGEVENDGLFNCLSYVLFCPENEIGIFPNVFDESLRGS